MLRNIIGFSFMEGVGKDSKKPYAMARLNHLTPIKSWKNENGHSSVAGFECNDRLAFNVDVTNQALIHRFLGLEYPVDLDLTFEPDPENPTRNIVTDFKEV